MQGEEKQACFPEKSAVLAEISAVLVEKSAVLVEKRRWDFHYEAMAGSLLYHQLIIHQQDFTD